MAYTFPHIGATYDVRGKSVGFSMIFSCVLSFLFPQEGIYIQINSPDG